VVRDSASQALQLLDLLPQITISLCIKEIPGENTSADLRSYLVSKRPTSILITYNVSDTVEQILHQLGEKISKPLDHAQFQKDHVEGGYTSVSLKLLTHLEESPCDLFLKMGKEGEDLKYLKRVNKLDPFPPNMIKDFEERGLKDLFVEINNLELFMTCVSNNLVAELTKPDQNADQLIEAQSKAYDYIINFSEALNFDKNVVEVVDTFVETQISILKTQTSLAKLIQAVVSKKHSLSFQGLYLTCLMIHHICRQLKVFSEQRMTKFTFVALFCDLGLESKDLYLIKSNAELLPLAAVLPPADLDKLKNHARKNADFLAQYPELPIEVLSIIRQHHGNPEGVGFIDEHNPMINEDTLLFMTANTFIKYFLHPQYKFDKKEILRIIGERFPHERMKPYLEALAAKID